MRNPGKRRNISLVLTLLGGSVLTATMMLNRGQSALGSWFTVAIVGFFTTLGAAIATMVFHFNYRLQRRLLEGHRLLGRWTVSANDWRQFAQDEAVRLKERRTNNFRVKSHAPDREVDVHVAEDAIMVDGDFYHLAYMRGLQWLPGAPPCLEYNMVTASKNGRVHWNVRFPVAEGAEPIARKIWNYAHPPVQPGAEGAEARRFARVRRNCLIVAAVFAPVLVYGVVAFRAGSLVTPTMVALILGIIGVGSTLLAALLCQVMYLGEMKRLKREAAAASKMVTLD